MALSPKPTPQESVNNGSRSTWVVTQYTDMRQSTLHNTKGNRKSPDTSVRTNPASPSRKPAKQPSVTNPLDYDPFKRPQSLHAETEKAIEETAKFIGESLLLIARAEQKIHDCVVALRRDYGLSVRDVASIVGVSHQTVANRYPMPKDDNPTPSG